MKLIMIRASARSFLMLTRSARSKRWPSHSALLFFCDHLALTSSCLSEEVGSLSSSLLDINFSLEFVTIRCHSDSARMNRFRS